MIVSMSSHKRILITLLYTASVDALWADRPFAPETTWDDASFMSIITHEKTPRYQAEETLRLCDMSYKKDQTWLEFVKTEEASGFQIIPFATHYEERSGFVRVHQDGVCDVVFKGTNNIQNMLSDSWANWALNLETGFRYHNGIMQHALTVLPEVAEILMSVACAREMPSKNLEIRLLGHSLGAGTALAIAPFLDGPFKISNIDGVAAPQIFDVTSADAFNERFGSKATCYSQDYDPVTYVGGLNLLRGLVSPLLCVLPESAPVGHQVTLPTKGSVHKVSGYQASLKDLDLTEGYTFAPRIDSTPKKWVKKLLQVPSRLEHCAHKLFVSFRNGLLKSFAR